MTVLRCCLGEGMLRVLVNDIMTYFYIVIYTYNNNIIIFINS